MQEDLKQCAPTVIEFLKHCCATYGANVNENTHIVARTLRCFTSWISVGAIGLHGLSDNVVLNLAFEILDFKPHEGKQVKRVNRYYTLYAFFVARFFFFFIRKIYNRKWYNVKVR